MQSVAESDFSFMARHKPPAVQSHAAGNWRKRSSSDLKKRHVMAASRRQANEIEFVERCKLAWDKKSALIDQRRLQKEEEVAARIAARGPPPALVKDIDDGANFAPRERTWLSAVCAVLAMESFRSMANGLLITSDSEVSAAPSLASPDSARSLRSPRSSARRSTASPGSPGSPNTRSFTQQEVEKSREILREIVRERLRQMRRPELTEDEKAKLESWKRWRLPLICCLAVIRLKRGLQKRRSGALVIHFMQLLYGSPNFSVQFKHRMKQIRLIQRIVKTWYFQEAVRKELLRTLLERYESDIVRRMLGEEDMATIKRERKRHQSTRAAGERKSIERTLAVARENYRKLMKPKSEADFEYQQHVLSRYLMPPVLLKSCATHAFSARKKLVRLEMEKRAKQVEAYQQEYQTWCDIEQAVQLIDPAGHNPVAPPKAPDFRRLPYLIKPAFVPAIVRKVRQCYEEIREARPEVDQELRAGKPVPKEIDLAILPIIESVLGV